ncbi:MAG: hypothetical protein ACOX17_05885 [Christensenellales bacterium]|jgi:hypothetical protein
MDPYEELANAIVLQVVKDYRQALKLLSENPHSRSAMAAVNEMERFFRSNWYETLTSVDGEMLMRKLREEASL